MSYNFYFTKVNWPDAKGNLTLTPIHALRSYLDACHWFPARQHSIRCTAVFRLIPCPTWIFILMTAGCRVATAGRTSPPCQNPDTGCRCTGSPHPTGMDPRLAIWCLQSRCQSLIPPARLHACLQDTALHWGLRTSFTAPARTSSPPLRQHWVISCPRPNPWDPEKPTRCSCSESAHMHDGELVIWLVQNKQGCSE